MHSPRYQKDDERRGNPCWQHPFWGGRWRSIHKKHLYNDEQRSHTGTLPLDWSAIPSSPFTSYLD